jgi:uncharacterized membrane protein
MLLLLVKNCTTCSAAATAAVTAAVAVAGVTCGCTAVCELHVRQGVNFTPYTADVTLASAVT